MSIRLPQIFADLSELADSDRVLTNEESQTIFDHIGFFIVADDEGSVLRSVARIVIRGRKDIVRIAGPTREGFIVAAHPNKTVRPLIECSGSEEAVQALEQTVEQGLQNGLFIFDDRMGKPGGLEIFNKYNHSLPPRIARVLHSGTLPKDIQTYVDRGVLDAAIQKPVGSVIRMRSDLARAYIGRLLREKQIPLA